MDLGKKDLVTMFNDAMEVASEYPSEEQSRIMGQQFGRAMFEDFKKQYPEETELSYEEFLEGMLVSQAHEQVTRVVTEQLGSMVENLIEGTKGQPGFDSLLEAVLGDTSDSKDEDETDLLN